MAERRDGYVYIPVTREKREGPKRKRTKTVRVKVEEVEREPHKIPITPEEPVEHDPNETVTVSVSMSRLWKEHLRSEAERRGLSMSEVVNRALADYIGEPGTVDLDSLLTQDED